MGYSKIVRVSDHEVRIVHQLGTDGTAYAEDIMVTTAPEVDAHRLDYLGPDGTIGYASVSFSPAAGLAEPPDVVFPERTS